LFIADGEHLPKLAVSRRSRFPRIQNGRWRICEVSHAAGNNGEVVLKSGCRQQSAERDMDPTQTDPQPADERGCLSDGLSAFPLACTPIALFASKVILLEEPNMDQNIVQEILHELFASLEALDTQTSAIRQFLKDKGIATEQELAPYLEQAGNASGVRWLAVRVRIDHLLSSAMKSADQNAKDAKKDSSQSAENKNEKEANAAPDKTGEKEPEKGSPTKDATEMRKVHTEGESEADQTGVGAEKNNNRENEEANRSNDNATKNAA
jgi:hypothetical protein